MFDEFGGFGGGYCAGSYSPAPTYYEPAYEPVYEPPLYQPPLPEPIAVLPLPETLPAVFEIPHQPVTWDPTSVFAGYAFAQCARIDAEAAAVEALKLAEQMLSADEFRAFLSDRDLLTSYLDGHLEHA